MNPVVAGGSSRAGANASRRGGAGPLGAHNVVGRGRYSRVVGQQEYSCVAGRQGYSRVAGQQGYSRGTRGTRDAQIPVAPRSPWRPDPRGAEIPRGSQCDRRDGGRAAWSGSAGTARATCPRSTAEAPHAPPECSDGLRTRGAYSEGPALLGSVGPSPRSVAVGAGGLRLVSGPVGLKARRFRKAGGSAVPWGRKLSGSVRLGAQPSRRPPAAQRSRGSAAPLGSHWPRDSAAPPDRRT